MIISGGGTGGHVFPAIAIANTFRQRHPDAAILFVGALGKMEMVRVPEAGYEIIGLWINGLQRALSLSNLLFPVRVIASYFRALSLLRRFNPHVVVGTGGFASGPVMMAAASRGCPSLIQEQNSYAGLANRRASRKAKRICVAYEGMEKYFPKEKIVFTGNPVRTDILDLAGKRERALSHFAFSANYKTLFVMGGSGGARTINESILLGMERLLDSQVQIIWVTGKVYYKEYITKLAHHDLRKIRVYDFLREVDLAYAASDVVISRSGAIAISELAVAQKAAILVPSPNVVANHQYKNASALVARDAALLIEDDEAREKLVNEMLKLVFDEDRAHRLSGNIAAHGRPKATDAIVDEIEKLIR